MEAVWGAGAYRECTARTWEISLDDLLHVRVRSKELWGECHLQWSSDWLRGVDLNSQSALILRKLLILQSAKTAKKAKVPIPSDIFLTLHFCPTAAAFAFRSHLILKATIRLPRSHFYRNPMRVILELNESTTPRMALFSAPDFPLRPKSAH